jgi:DNA repair protein RadA/Sms
MHSEILSLLNDDEFASYICTECEGIFEKKTDNCPKCKAAGAIVKIEITPKLYDEDFGLFDDTEDCFQTDGSGPCHMLSASKAALMLENNQFDVKIKACSSGISEFDSLFGDKAIMGTVNLFIGAQASGKTAFFMKIAEGYSKSGHKTLYVSSEESSWQITDRLQRMNINAPKLFLSQASDLDFVLNEISGHKPDIVFLDSMSGFFRKQIDAIQSSNIQIRECAAELAKIAKEKNITIFAVANNVSSSTILEFDMISYFFDSILHLEPLSNNIKLARVKKNRNSHSEAVSLFYSDHSSLRPLSKTEYETVLSAALDNKTGGYSIGKISCFYDECGIDMYNELESIVGGFSIPAPRWNISSGIKHDTFETVAMIVEKYNEINLHDKNINIRLKSPAHVTSEDFNLSIAASIVSSYYNIAVSNQVLFIGGIDYSGAVTPARLSAIQLGSIQNSGFKTIISSNLKKENFENHSSEVNFHNIQNIKYLRELLSSLSLEAEKTKR